MKSLPAESLIKRTEYSGQYLQDLLVAVMEGTGTVGNCMKSVAHGIESFGCETESDACTKGAMHPIEPRSKFCRWTWFGYGPGRSVPGRSSVSKHASAFFPAIVGAAQRILGTVRHWSASSAAIIAAAC